MLPLLTILLAVTVNARISVMYAHDKVSDYAAEQCLTEMFPKNKLKQIQETDEPCIIFCVLKKFGIITPGGSINLDVYKRRVNRGLGSNGHNNIADFGQGCFETAESTKHSVDVCIKAKLFNDCTHLYKILLK